MTSDEVLARFAALGQPTAGVVTAAQLRLAGADQDAVRAVVRARGQVPVRGVYVLHQGRLTDEELAHVALAHAGPGAVLTGVVAARAAGMRWLPDLPGAMVLVEGEVRRQSSDGLVLVRRCADIATLPTVAWRDVVTAPPAQVVVDTCRQLVAVRTAGVGGRPGPRLLPVWEEHVLREVRGVVLGAVADGLCDPREVLARLDAGSVRDTKLVRRAAHDALRGAASPPEAELVDGLLGLGVPFGCNVEVHVGGRLVAVLDVYLLGTGVGGELDSREAHGSETQLDATLLRHRTVERLGLQLLHVTPNRYRSGPDAFHDELVAEVRRRQARGLGEPQDVSLVLRGPVLCGPVRPRPPYRFTAAVAAHLPAPAA